MVFLFVYLEYSGYRLFTIKKLQIFVEFFRRRQDLINFKRPKKKRKRKGKMKHKTLKFL